MSKSLRTHSDQEAKAEDSGKSQLGLHIKTILKKQNKAKHGDLDVSWALRTSLSEAQLGDSKIILFNKNSFTTHAS